MDYALESLAPDTFQEMVQALIAKEHPNTQCFAVGQSDGGRDALSFTHRHRESEYILYQVKFTRFPAEVRSAADWMIAAIKEEIPKIADLARRGARQYIVVTNIRGTPAPGAGSYDKVSEFLRANCPIQTICWWRDDVYRRLDNAWDIKWVYPSLLTGPDILRAVLQSGLSDDVDRRDNALRSTVIYQHKRDNDVRFKQIELQHSLLDLFIDAPLLEPQLRDRKTSEAWTAYQSMRSSLAQEQTTFPGEIDATLGRTSNVGAATFLLSGDTQTSVPNVVLEGGPGQGKSTLSQYVCQVHRMRILGKANELSQIDERHRSAPIRFPLRVDLRDFATWQSRRDPFGPGEVVDRWNRSLDAFLAAMIRHCSGGCVFDVSDLHIVSKLTALLIVLDGLDEIADMETRTQVVEEIASFSDRVGGLSASLQIIVTSRPAAFANSPGLSMDNFVSLTLGSLDSDLIIEYGERWAKIRHLEDMERSQVLSILENKLSQPHLRDLARNPMQLAILLSLIQSRGASLPDKRTALYDAYVDLFFSRESEKSVIVRQHRDLLLNVHQYVAWLIHCETEKGDSSGAISEVRLRQVVREFLERDGHDPQILGKLFTGIIDRVVALVSRVQGTYEFEVQPLREYFAARYLYNTAPYSPAGSERTGTKLDRFEALARNFYWLNVTRFYAGCYSKGELPSLVDSLRSLMEERPFDQLFYPSSLAQMLLADWVFAQHPRSAKDVARLVSNRRRLRLQFSQRQVDPDEFRVGDEAARRELLEICWGYLESESEMFPDESRMMALLMRNNSTPTETFSRWRKNLESGAFKQYWIVVGQVLGHLESMEKEQLLGCLDHSRFDECVVAMTDRADALDLVPTIRETLTKGLLAGRSLPIRHDGSVISAFANRLDPHRYVPVFREKGPHSLAARWKRSHLRASRPLEIAGLEKESLFIDMAQRMAERSTSEWATSLEPWSSIVEFGRNTFGDCWAFYRLASMSAGARSGTSLPEAYSEFSNPLVDLCGRARYARLRAGNAAWWQVRMNEEATVENRMFRLLLLLGWGSTKTIGKLVDACTTAVDGLVPDAWLALWSGLRMLTAFVSIKDERLETGFLAPLGPRFASLMMLRCGLQDRYAIYRNSIRDQSGDHQVNDFALSVAVESILRGGDEAEADLEFVRRAYRQRVRVDSVHSRALIRRGAIRLDLCERICSAPEEFPLQLLVAAQDRVQNNITPRPVVSVADSDAWFA